MKVKYVCAACDNEPCILIFVVSSSFYYEPTCCPFSRKKNAEWRRVGEVESDFGDVTSASMTSPGVTSPG